MRRTIRGSRPGLLVLLVLVAALAAGCKKTPPAVSTEPEPPPVQSTEPAAEPVRDDTMRPIEERPSPAQSMTADALNAQGLLKAIYFDFDDYEIRPDQRPTLQGNADQLKKQPLSGFRVVIEGHCDERGTNEYNMALGDRRANAARQYLIGLGVPASRIRTISYGEERAADPGHNEESWARNRRAEFVLEEG